MVHTKNSSSNEQNTVYMILGTITEIGGCGVLGVFTGRIPVSAD